MDEAATHYRRALALRPNYVMCLTNLARLHLARRHRTPAHLGEAVQAARRAVELTQGRDAGARGLLADVCAAAGLPDEDGQAAGAAP